VRARSSTCAEKAVERLHLANWEHDTHDDDTTHLGKEGGVVRVGRKREVRGERGREG
jgi:hypothetical protein